jgi:hypothetical protein
VDRRETSKFGATSHSPQSYNLLRYWLNDCLTNHRLAAGFGSRGTFFPDRVIDVGYCGDRTIKLLSRTALDQIRARNHPYATLSYCWGDARHLKLESATLERFERGINIMELPRTMRQAVAAAREVGVRYLWIDSMCIIQDSRDDWRIQSAFMGSIYRHSHINFAASASSTSEGGLFFERNPQSIRPIQVTCHFPFDQSGIPSRLYNVVRQKPYHETVGQAPLNNRGWVVQERLLSPRTVHCTQGQLFWECQHTFANESYPQGLVATSERRPGEFQRMLMRLHQNPMMPVAQGIQIQSTSDWLSLVMEYTRCKLSNEEDILIALSGLARLWNDALPDRYLAGLWKESFAAGLIWHREPKIPELLVNAEPCSIWRAPSWSWASFNGAVTWSHNVVPLEHVRSNVNAFLTLVQFVDADMISESADEFGQLSYASLTIGAGVIVGMISSGSQWRRDFENIFDLGINGWTLDWQDRLDLALEMGPDARKTVFRTENSLYEGVCYFDSGEMRHRLAEAGILTFTGIPVLLSVVSYANSGNDGTSIRMEVEGILVRMNAGGTLSRMGYFCASSELGDVETSYQFFQGLQDLSLQDTLLRLGFGVPEVVTLI